MSLNTSPDQLSKGSSVGTQLGQSATDLVGFWGATPVAQRSGSTQSALTVTATTGGGVYGFTTSTLFSAAMAQLEELRAAMVQYGMLKGS